MTPFFELNSGYFANTSFVFLFLAMTFYWINLAFFDKQKSNLVQPTGFSSSLISFLGISKFGNPEPSNQKNLTFSSVPKLTLILSNISLILLLCTRWKESGHFPLSNLYESLMFLSWSCTSINIVLLLGISKLGNPGQNVKKDLFMEKLLGAVLAPCALFLNAFATFSLPKEMQQAGPLVPALQSNWLMMHVTVMIVSYAALILGSLLSIAFVIYNYSFFKAAKTLSKPSLSDSTSTIHFLENGNALKASDVQDLPKSSSWGESVSLGFPVAEEQACGTELSGRKFHSTASQALKSPTLHDKILYNLDYYSYRIIGIGFPFLTIGILSGAVWANEAWGSYWSWDPKETWALLTWLVFAIYLHTRFTKGWEGIKPAMIASFGFIVVWVCYLGVNLLGEGLHSYGFLT
jgi:cytochrome c-type biogenesis protein CcsB